MKYISIDIETTGIDPNKDQILSIGAIIEDTNNLLTFEECPKFHVALVNDRIEGSPFALNMNKDLIGLISKWMNSDSDTQEVIESENNINFTWAELVVRKFQSFLITNDFEAGYPMSITVAGKNFGTFDKLFLEKLPEWNDLIRIKQRIIDPAVLYVDWSSDKELPNLPKCKSRAGLEEIVTHNALEDAWDVIQVLRQKY